MKISEKSLSIIALIVSLLSAGFSYMQFQSSEAQLRLNEQQLRPHVSNTPTFFRSKNRLDIDLYFQNQSPLPANVLYSDLSAWVGEQYIAVSFHSIAPDILYQDKGGVSRLPPIDGKLIAHLDSGNETLMLATCAIYSSTSKRDSRRWHIKALHEYIPGSHLPRRLLIQEEEVPLSTGACETKDVRESFIKTLSTSSTITDKK